MQEIDEQLSDDLYTVSERTNRDGTVDVELSGIEKSGDDVHVAFRTPTNELQVESMPFPNRDSSEYKFVRLCRQTVGDLSRASALSGSMVKADPDNWTLVAPKPSFSKIRRHLSMLTVGSVVRNGFHLSRVTVALGFALLAFLMPVYGFLSIGGVVPVLTAFGIGGYVATWLSCVLFAGVFSAPNKARGKS